MTHRRWRRFGRTFRALAALDIQWRPPDRLAGIRGRANYALRALRECEPQLEDRELAAEVERRAWNFERLWPNATPTATALAKNWRYVERLSDARGPYRGPGFA